MASIHLKVYNEMIHKLGISSNDRLASKSLEIQELIKVKSSETFKHINDNARVVLCIHISCELLNIPIEATSSDLVKLSSMTKSQYNKTKKLILKVLDLDRKITIDEIIRKLGITHAVMMEKTAKNILKTYLHQHSFDNTSTDPCVYAMSVYFACKLENIKIAKKNILSLSNLTQSKWALMEKSWEKWVSGAHCKAAASKESVQKNVPESVGNAPKESANKQKLEVEETYDSWAKRILTQARKELKQNNL